MKVFVVLYGRGWPEDGDDVAGVYTTQEAADAAAKHENITAWVKETELDSAPVFTQNK